ncbi:MAG: zinc ribbon domain-containing protein [Clostridia bacterium]|nr:zinc ribbon domain-containing protein [Clostridia bacterium]
MSMCSNCSAVLEEGLKFCPNCGAAVVVKVNEPAEAEETKNAQNGFETAVSEKISHLNDTKDDTDSFDKADIEKNKVMAVLAYIIFLIPLFAAKDSPFARFHTNQGLLLVIAAVILSVIAAIPVIGWIIAPVIGIAVTVLAVIGILNALNGKAKELPLIGKFRILK